MNIEEAIQLARSLEYGPLPKSSVPTPTVREARDIILEELNACKFNWITAQTALKILNQSLENALT